MEKIKAYIASDKGKNLLTAIIIILVGFASYGAGRLSENGKRGDLTIEYPQLPVATIGTVPVQPVNTGIVKGTQATVSNIKTYFASNRGSKYYHLGCAGGKTLKEENKIYFNSAEEAERAGYELSSSCR